MIFLDQFFFNAEISDKTNFVNQDAQIHNVGLSWLPLSVIQMYRASLHAMHRRAIDKVTLVQHLVLLLVVCYLPLRLWGIVITRGG